GPVQLVALLLQPGHLPAAKRPLPEGPAVLQRGAPARPERHRSPAPQEVRRALPEGRPGPPGPHLRAPHPAPSVSRRGAPGPPDGREPRLAEFHLGPLESSTPPRVADRAPGPASLSQRVMAATADLAAVMLGVSLPVVAASAIVGRWPTPGGLAWAALFAVTFSFGTTV